MFNMTPQQMMMMQMGAALMDPRGTYGSAGAAFNNAARTVIPQFMQLQRENKADARYEDEKSYRRGRDKTADKRQRKQDQQAKRARADNMMLQQMQMAQSAGQFQDSLGIQKSNLALNERKLSMAEEDALRQQKMLQQVQGLFSPQAPAMPPGAGEAMRPEVLAQYQQEAAKTAPSAPGGIFSDRDKRLQMATALGAMGQSDAMNALYKYDAATKPTDRQTKIREAVKMGADEKTATGILDGFIKPQADPNTGMTVYVDTRTFTPVAKVNMDGTITMLSNAAPGKQKDFRKLYMDK